VSTSSASLYCTLKEPSWTCLDRRARGTISQVTYFPQFKQLPLLLSTRTIDFSHWHTKDKRPNSVLCDGHVQFLKVNATYQLQVNERAHALSMGRKHRRIDIANKTKRLPT